MGVRGAQQRRLLAILLLHANQVVGRDRLVDLLWGEDPPMTATHGLEVQVSRLRKLLGPERLEASAGGYVLRVAPGELDVHRFRLLAAEGRRQLEQGDPAAALELLSEALATAGGRPLEEFENEPFARAEASALIELRLGLTEDRFAAELALGRGAELVPELEKLVSEAPARERPRAQLMLALYRAGRQADALETYRAARRTLVEEFGLEPGRELQELERAILAQDPGLDTPSDERPRRDTAVRRIVTVLAAEPSTDSASEDPERLRQLTDRFRTTLTRELERFGAVVESAGERVDATFGALAAQEDHAVRALLAALAAQAVLRGARIGVDSGEVVVDHGRAGGPTITGATLNVAVALAHLAAAGETLVGERTVALSGPLFVFGSRREFERSSRGKRLLARPLEEAAGRERPLGLVGLGRTFVGREPELELLRTTYRRVLERGESHIVTILGDAGVGKTSLVGELASWLDGQSPRPAQRRGRCLSYGRGDTYGPLAAVLRAHVGLGDTSSADEVLGRLTGKTILALTFGTDVAANLHPLAAREQLHAAWVGLFEEIAADGPAVIVIEDLHWADEPLLDLLEVVAREARAPFMLVATARPEFADTRRSWTSMKRNSSALSLEPLTPHDAESMVRHLLVGEPPPGLGTLVGDRAEGNPFFVEELLASLLDGKLLYRRERGWQLDMTRASSIPDSVRGVISARFDLLDQREQTALEAASVLGGRFTEADVRQFVTEDADFTLLENRGFVRRQAVALGEERAYVFKHALTREVVYAGLAKPLRARLHAAVAEQLEHAAEMPDEAATLLAHHYGEAVGLGDVDLIWPDEPPRADELRSKAVRWLSRAGVLAIRRFAIDDGLVLLHRALAFEPAMAVQGQIWRVIGRAHAVRYAGDQAIEAYERAAELVPGSDQRGEIYAELAFETVQRYAMLNPLPPREVVDSWIERALASAPAATHARASALVARALWFADSDAAADEAVSISEELDDIELRSHAYNAKAVSAFVARRYDDSLAWARRRLALADSISDPDHLVDIESMVIPGLLGRARFDEARRHAQLHDEAASRLSPHHQVHAVAMKLELEELTGRWDMMTALAERTRATVEANVDTPCVRNSRSLLACALASAQLGDVAATSLFEQRAGEIAMAGYDAVFAPLRIRLAIARGDLGALERLVGQALPPPPAKNWWTLCTEAARLDALTALRDTQAIDAEAPPYAVPGTYLEPFALRALGVVHDEVALLDHAQASFTALGLDWFASQTLR